MAVVSLLFVAGLFSLCKGGDLLVDSAVFFARKFHISEVIIGAVILSIGTTFPEITVSATAAVQGVSAISYGNAVGSVICNTALIGGILCLLLPSDIESGGIFKSVVFVLRPQFAFVPVRFLEKSAPLPVYFCWVFFSGMLFLQSEPCGILAP